MRRVRFLVVLSLSLLWLPFLACGDAAVPASTANDASAQDGAHPTSADAEKPVDSSHDSVPITDAGPDASFDAGPSPLPARCNGSVRSTAPPSAALPALPPISVPAAFKMEPVGHVYTSRHIVQLPNGDLLAGTNTGEVRLIPHADEDVPGDSVLFVDKTDDLPVHGVAYAPYLCTIFIATQHFVYAVPYVDGQMSAVFGDPIARVRDPNIGEHVTTTVAFDGTTLFASVGSSCNDCVETDPLRATIQRMYPDGGGQTTRATRMRNAIALALNPATGTLWAGGAGQDFLPSGHPYEYFDSVGLRGGIPDYGWPDCEENQVAYVEGADCSKTAVPHVELPAYSTIISATFYPSAMNSVHAFPSAYRGGLFLTAHGAAHTNSDGGFVTPPRVVYVPMNGDTPVTPVNWNDPTTQWTDFVTGCQLADGVTRVARPTGITVGRDGSLFLADDLNSTVVRIRPR